MSKDTWDFIPALSLRDNLSRGKSLDMIQIWFHHLSNDSDERRARTFKALSSSTL